MISVIVPVYKVEEYLRQCLDSVINQTYKELEIIIVDDGSPDNCGLICDEYARNDSRITVYHTENHGLSAARNYGIERAHGDFIGFVDSDDWLEPQMYEKLLDAAQKSGSSMCVCKYYKDETPTIHTDRNIQKCDVYEGTDSIVSALLDNKINVYAWNKLYHVDLFKEIKFPEGMNFEDILTTHKLALKAGKVAIIRDKLYNYRIRMNSICHTYKSNHLILYSNAITERCNYLSSYCTEDMRDKLNKVYALGISKVWRWWHACSGAERKEFAEKIEELCSFSKSHFDLFGKGNWPFHLRLAVFFMHSKSGFSFASIYYINQMFRRFRIIKKNFARSLSRPSNSTVYGG